MSKLIDLTGQRFGRLVVLCRVENTAQGQACWHCICDCGNKITVPSQSLRLGHTASCGCLRNERLKGFSTTHNESKSRLFSIWMSMKKRTMNKNDKNYKHYGGRGITICDEWKSSFQKFRDWALKNGYAENLTIDRIDNDKEYSPDNCRWVDMKTQGNNKRTNRRLTYKGETKTFAEWGQLIGGNATLIRDRIDKLGWSIERALTTPVKGKK